MDYFQFSILRARGAILSWLLFTAGLVAVYYVAGADAHMVRVFVMADAAFAVAALFGMARASRYLRGRRNDGDMRSLADETKVALDIR